MAPACSTASAKAFLSTPLWQQLLCLLTNLLIELLEAAVWAKVVNLSSLAHTWAKQGIQWDDIKWEQKFFDCWEV